MAAIFALSAAVQWNDPDPLRWVAFYGLACATAIAGAIGRPRFPLELATALVSLGIAAALLPAAETARREAFSSFHMQSPDDELARELGGAALVLAFALAMLGRRARARVRARAAASTLAVALTLGAGCNAWRTFFPSHDHDEVAPSIPALAHPAVLLFTKTNGYRHAEAIDAGVPAIERIAKERGISLFHTENGAAHEPSLLARFDAVVWFQTSGDVLSLEQRAALRSFIEAGGGFVAVHGAIGDPSYDWKWYVRDLVGAQFIGHTMGPQFQTARAIVEDRDHPVTRGLPAEFEHEEEWYSFDASPRARGARVLVRVDESSYEPELFGRDIRMGEDHPVVWSHCPGRGRAVFSALGHQASAYASPANLALLGNAIVWAATGANLPCDDALAPSAD